MKRRSADIQWVETHETPDIHREEREGVGTKEVELGLHLNDYENFLNDLGKAKNKTREELDSLHDVFEQITDADDPRGTSLRMAVRRMRMIADWVIARCRLFLRETEHDA